MTENAGRRTEAAWAEVQRHLLSGEVQPSPHTMRSHHTGLKELFTYVGDSEIDPTSLRDLSAYAQWLTQQGKSKGTILKRVGTARLVLSLVYGLNPGTLSPVTSKVEATRRTPYTEAEVQRLLAVAHPEERLIVDLALEGGLTVSEIATLRREDVHLQARLPYLQLPLADGSSVRVFINEPLAQTLNSWLTRTPHSSGPLTPGRTQPYVNARMRALCRCAEVPCRGLHGLRMTGAARLYRDTGSLDQVGNYLRVRTPAVVRTYAAAAALLGPSTT